MSGVATQRVPADKAAIETAAKILRGGGLVAFPTETVYGLGADATNGEAVAGIFAAKRRPRFNPLIVHVQDRAQAEAFAEFSAQARALADAFWPGALTLVLPRRADSALSLLVSAGLDTVALRAPAHVLARQLIVETGRPIAAPSANASGRVSPTTAAHVAEELGDAAARERPSLAVVAPAAHQIGALPAWNRGAVAAQVPWLFASADFGTQGFAGPLFLPPETGCYECFARRRQSHSFLKDNFDNLDGGLRAGDAPFFFIDLLAGLATSLSARWLVSSDPIIPGRCQVIDAGRICEVSTHLLYKVPRCTVCSAATSISPVAPWGIKAKAEEPRR